MYIYSHAPSDGATELAKVLGIKKIKREGSLFRGNPTKVVINWGASEVTPEVAKCRIINKPEDVRRASDKVEFFRMVANGENTRIVPWTTNREQATNWARESRVVVRALTRSSGGNGISFVEPGGNVPAAPLYTKYIPKKHEYRVHFVNGQIIDYQRKALRPDVDKNAVDWKVRNLENGFIFVRGDVVLPDDVRRQAENCILDIDLDFGAIDLIWNEKSNLAYVLEVNTAPGLVGSTVTSYANALRNM